jgi:hypothetical protein
MFQDAEEWILEKDTDWPFSFETICEVLGLNPDYVRQGLVRWKEAKLAGRRPNVYRLAPRSAKRQGGGESSSQRGNRRLLKAAGRR